MGKDDYTATSGGALKLKGAKPTGIDKKRKKKLQSATDSVVTKKTDTAIAAEEGDDEEKRKGNFAGVLGEEMDELRRDEGDGEEGDIGGKTEAQRRFEETRRKRVSLCSVAPFIGHILRETRAMESLMSFTVVMNLQLDERLRREGLKTHKERVEELNKYLSNLSEHHDMYVPLKCRGHFQRRQLMIYFFTGRESDRDNRISSPLGQYAAVCSSNGSGTTGSNCAHRSEISRT